MLRPSIVTTDATTMHGQSVTQSAGKVVVMTHGMSAEMFRVGVHVEMTEPLPCLRLRRRPSPPLEHVPVGVAAPASLLAARAAIPAVRLRPKNQRLSMRDRRPRPRLPPPLPPLPPPQIRRIRHRPTATDKRILIRPDVDRSVCFRTRYLFYPQLSSINRSRPRSLTCFFNLLMIAALCACQPPLLIGQLGTGTGTAAF